MNEGEISSAVKCFREKAAEARRIAASLRDAGAAHFMLEVAENFEQAARMTEHAERTMAQIRQAGT